MAGHTLTKSRMRYTWLAQHILIESGALTRGWERWQTLSGRNMRMRWRWFAQCATIHSEMQTTGGAHRTQDTRERGRRLAHPHRTRHGNERRRQLAHPHRTRHANKRRMLAHPHQTRYGHNTRPSDARHERWVEVVAATAHADRTQDANDRCTPSLNTICEREEHAAGTPPSNARRNREEDGASTSSSNATHKR